MLNMEKVKDLLDILTQEAVIYEELREISAKKKDIIIKNKIQELDSLVKLEQSMILQIARLEDHREGITESLATQMGKSPEAVTVSELTAYLAGEQGEKLEACRRHILDVLEDLKSNNELNAKLINDSLEYIDFSINIFAGAAEQNNNYSSSGQVNASKKRNLFDVKL